MTTQVTIGDVAEFNSREAHVGLDDTVAFVPLADLDILSATAGPGISRLYREVQKGYTVFRNHDLLVAKITPSFENGKIGQARLAHQIGVGSTEFHVIRPDRDKVDDRYLLHFLRQPWVRTEGERRMTGSAGQKRVPASFLSTLKLRLPVLAEQRRIAAILDQADALRAKRRLLIAGIDDLERACFLATFGDPRGWPARWPMGVIGDTCESVAYGSSSKAGTDGQWPILRMGNLTMAGRIDLTDLKYLDLAPSEVPKYTVKRGDILFNRTNSPELVGKTAVVRTDQPLAFAGYLIRLRTSDGYNPEFISGYLNSAHGKAVLRGMNKAIIGQANINAKELRAIPIALPPKSLQGRFAARITAIESQRAAAQRSLEKLDELFASLQARAFSGQL